MAWRPTPQAWKQVGQNRQAQPRPVVPPGWQAQPPVAPGPKRLVPSAISYGTSPSAVAATAAATGLESYVVATTGNDVEEVVVKTLIGEYVEQGQNHGRKVFKKVNEKGHEGVDVFLYYWDERDGPSFQGWWFGNKLGGTQVWSQCTEQAMKPPSGGWKIPWDGQVRPTLSVTQKVVAPGAADTLASPVLQLPSEISSEVVMSAKAALEEAKAAAGDYSYLEGVKMAEQLLMPHVTNLTEALRKATEGQRGAIGDQQRHFIQLANQIRTMQSAVNAELQKLKAGKSKAENSERLRAAEENDAAALAEVMPEATQKANAAEDAVEKALITNDMIANAADDLEELKQAVLQTEQAVHEAQKAIGEARIFLNAKLTALKRLETPRIRQEAAKELGKLQNQLVEAQTKLGPLKTVRQDFVQRTAAQKMVQEILEKLSPAEVDVDRAEEATSLLVGDTLSKELMPQAEQAVQKASDHINQVVRFIEAKKRAANGLAREEALKMEERARASLQRLTQLKSSHREAMERVAVDMLLRDAQEKLQSVAEAVAKAAEAEAPFLMGVEELPMKECQAAVKACESAATAANTAVSIARMFLATKMVEVKRFTQKSGEDSQAKIKEYQAELEVQTKKLAELKAGTLRRKQMYMMREAEVEVQKVEELVKQVAEAASVLEDDEKLLSLGSQEIRAASDQVQKAEQMATAALSDARKFLTARQIEAKSKDSTGEAGSELVKLQARLSAAQTEILKHKKLSTSVDDRIAAKKVVEESSIKVKAAEEKVEAVATLVTGLNALPEAAAGPDLKAAEKAAAEAQVAIKAATRFLEMQMRMHASAKEDIEKVQPRIQAAQERLDSTVSGMKERIEKLQVETIVSESEVKVKEAEEAVQKVIEAQKRLTADEPGAEVSERLQEVEATDKAATSLLGNAKTFIAMKRLNAKRLSEAFAAPAGEKLTALATRLEEAMTKLREAKKVMAEHRVAAIKRELALKEAEVDAKVKAALEATQHLSDESAGDRSTEDMKAVFEKAGSTQAEAIACLAKVREMLAERQKDTKLTSDSTMLGEVLKMQEKLVSKDKELEQQKKLLREQEHGYVAKKLQKDAEERVVKLEEKLEAAKKAAEPLVSEDGAFATVLFLTAAIDALKAYLQKESKSAQDLVKELGDGKGSILEANFVATMLRIQDKDAGDGTALSEEQLKQAFKRLASSDTATEVKEEIVLDEFQSRYMCTTAVTMTDSLTLKGGKTLRKVELDEVLLALEEPVKEEAVGLMRVKVKAESDGKEGYVTLSGNQGTVYLAAFSPLVACQQRIERALVDTVAGVKELSKYLDTKVDELKAVKAGPLQLAKQELVKLRQRVSRVLLAQGEVRKKVADSQQRHNQLLEAEKKSRQEAAEKKAAGLAVEEVTQSVVAVETAASEATTEAEALITSRCASAENPLAALDSVVGKLTALQAEIDAAQQKIKARLDMMKGTAKGPWSEARSSIVKQKVKLATLETKCKKTAHAVSQLRTEIGDDMYSAVRSALRKQREADKLTPQSLFKELAGAAEVIPVDALKGYLTKSPDSSVKASQIDLGLARFSGQVSEIQLLEMLQEYRCCSHEIAVTPELKIGAAKPLRKLAPGEYVEVLEAEQKEEGTGLPRVRCRLLQDQLEGWVTLRGNQGTSFIDLCKKPYLCCEEETGLQKTFETGTEEVRRIHPGEVFEVLEGPRREAPTELQRARGKACKDNKLGWVTLSDSKGSKHFELAKLLVCKQSIAITTAFNIAEGKAIRKLDAGETLEIVEGPKEDEERKLSRILARAKSDGKEGWVTVRGNQGTSFVEETSKHYVCVQSVPLETKLASGSTAVRAMEVGEVFEVLEGPKTEVKEGSRRVRGRNISNNLEGWFTVTDKSFRPWASAFYTVTQSTVMNETLNISDAKLVRKLEVGERVEALQTPVFESAASLVRARVRAEKDGALGFATVRGSQGSVFLTPASP